MALAAGSRLGPYEILAPIGAGGMGEVYRARDPRLGRDVAIKVITDAANADPDRLHRFEQEARAVAALSHPNVLAIFDVGIGRGSANAPGSDPGGPGEAGSGGAGVDLPFLVTELLDGETLRALIARGPLPPPRTVDLALQLVSGLAAAHARGIIHRDLKPDNLFVTTSGHLKILDFGLAKQTAPLAAAETTTTRPRPQTLRGTVLGTVGYMSPEQVRGLEVDHRTDLFASGAILYEMLTGQRAFRGDSAADTISAILNAPPSALVFAGDTPPTLARVVRRCLEKDLAARFQSADDLGAAIESVSDIRGASAAGLLGERTETRSVAVLPFVNLSADAENQYFSDGLAEELINALTRLTGLRVASRTSSFRFRGRDEDIRHIGRDLSVGAILEGSVRRAGARLRITAQLTNTADGYAIWSGRYDRQMLDLFDIQDEIVEAIVNALAPALLHDARIAVQRPTENLDAYERYLKGRHFWSQRSPAVVGTAIRCFEEAIALDPKYAMAYAGLADCYAILHVYGWTPPDHTQPRALEAVTHALALEPDLPEAHFSKALYTFHFERHWRAARQHFVDALVASPRNAMFEAYFGLFLAAEYAYPEARAHVDRGLELDPHAAGIHFLAASAACLMDDVIGVERHAGRALELQPEGLGARWPQTVALVTAGRIDEALVVGERVIARTRAPIYLGVLGMIYGCAGRLADARRVGQELDERQSRGEYIVPAARLSVQLGLKDADGVRRALAACVDSGAAPLSIVSTARHLLDAWRGDAEIDQLLDRLHDGARPPAAPVAHPAQAAQRPRDAPHTRQDISQGQHRDE